MTRTRAAVAVLAMVALCAGCLVAFRGRSPEAVKVIESGAGSSRAAERELTVHVAGAVGNPGLYRVGEGSRVADALQKAGGPAADALLDNLNLAAKLKDGEKIMVPRSVPGDGGVAGGAPANSGPGGPVNINTAGRSELEELPGVGPSLADRIIRHREKNGQFSSVDELDEVEGIGPRKLEALRDLVTI